MSDSDDLLAWHCNLCLKSKNCRVTLCPQVSFPLSKKEKKKIKKNKSAGPFPGEWQAMSSYGLVFRPRKYKWKYQAIKHINPGGNPSSAGQGFPEEQVATPCSWGQRLLCPGAVTPRRELRRGGFSAGLKETRRGGGVSRKQKLNNRFDIKRQAAKWCFNLSPHHPLGLK